MEYPKGGIDAITKLIESCRERIGIRGDCTIACARIIIYFVVVFHRLKVNGILSAEKDLDDYPTISHYHNAAGHRCTMMASVEDDDNILALPDVAAPTGAFAPSPLGQVTVVDQSVRRGGRLTMLKRCLMQQ